MTAFPRKKPTPSVKSFLPKIVFIYTLISLAGCTGKPGSITILTNIPSKSDTTNRISFFNSGELVTLISETTSAQHSNEMRNYVNASLSQEHRFGVFNRLLVTGNQALKNEEWESLVGATEVKMLANLGGLVILSVHLPDWRLQDAINKVSVIDGVINVQPDMVVIRNNEMHGPDTFELVEPAKKTDALPLKLRVDSMILKSSGKKDKPVRVALVDDGFNLEHPALSDSNVVFQYDIQTGTLDTSPKTSIDRHGTPALGILQAKPWKNIRAGLAPDAEIVALRLVSARSSKLVLAMFLARSMSADIINMSLRLTYLPQPMLEVLDYKNTDNYPPIVVAAAGNNGKDACEDNQLSKIKNVILVGSIENNGEHTLFSNYGECVDIYAPYNIPSTSYDGISTHTSSGTSSSAVVVAGKLCQLLAGFNYRPPLAHMLDMLEIVE